MAKSWWKRLFGKERQTEAPTWSEEARDLSQETRRGEQPELDESYDADRYEAERREMDRGEAWLEVKAQERAEAARQEAQRLLGPWLEAVNRHTAPGDAWRGTLSEAIHESQRRASYATPHAPPSVGFASARWREEPRVRVELAPDFVARVTTLESAGPIYGLRDDGAIVNTVTRRVEYVRVGGGQDGQREELSAALEVAVAEARGEQPRAIREVHNPSLDLDI